MRRPVERIGAVVALTAVAALIAGCGGSDNTGATATTATTAPNTVESQLQTSLADATDACKQAAGQISNSTAQSAAEKACEQLNSSLSQDISSAAEEAKGDVGEALNNLAADCRKAAGNLPTAGNVADSFCEAISASAGSVSGSG